MSKRTITEKIQGMRERHNVRRIGRMDTNARHEHIRKQMETYKEKTRMLQQMMDSQEALARELQMMEKEMEAQRREAEAEVIQQKSAAKDEHMAKESHQLEQRMEQLEQQIDQLAGNMDQLSENTGAIWEQEQRLYAAMEELAGRLDGIRHELNGGFDGIREGMASGDGEDMGDTLGRLDEIKEELSEKVHTESVKCYRNVQSLVDETKEELKEACKPSGASELKGPLTGAIVLGVVNLILLVALGLLELGIFHF